MDGGPESERERWASSMVAEGDGPDLVARIAGLLEFTGRLSLIGCIRQHGLAQGLRCFAELYGLEVPGGTASLRELQERVAKGLHLAEARLRDALADAIAAADDAEFRGALGRFGLETAAERSLATYAEACLSTIEGDLEEALAAHRRQAEGLFTVGEAVAMAEVLSLFDRYLRDLQPADVAGELERARLAERERLHLAGDVERLSRESACRGREIEELRAALENPRSPLG